MAEEDGTANQRSPNTQKISGAINLNGELRMCVSKLIPLAMKEQKFHYNDIHLYRTLSVLLFNVAFITS